MEPSKILAYLLIVLSVIIIFISKKIERAKKNPTILLNKITNGLEIIIVRTFGRTLLVVNGFVLAEQKGFKKNYVLKGEFKNKEIVFVKKSKFMISNLLLYCDYELISQKTNFIFMQNN